MTGYDRRQSANGDRDRAGLARLRWAAFLNPSFAASFLQVAVARRTSSTMAFARDGEDELVRAGAYRVCQDPADLLRHLDELGVRAE